MLHLEVFPLSKLENVLVTPVGTKIFVLIMEVFSIVSQFRGFVKRGSAVLIFNINHVADLKDVNFAMLAVNPLIPIFFLK